MYPELHVCGGCHALYGKTLHSMHIRTRPRSTSSTLVTSRAPGQWSPRSHCMQQSMGTFASLARTCNCTAAHLPHKLLPPSCWDQFSTTSNVNAPALTAVDLLAPKDDRTLVVVAKVVAHSHQRTLLHCCCFTGCDDVAPNARQLSHQ
jgi:hypothetical protein